MNKPYYWEEIDGIMGRQQFFNGPEWVFHLLRKTALFLEHRSDAICGFIAKHTEEVTIADE